MQNFPSDDENEDEDEEEDEEALHELQLNEGGVVVDGEHYDADYDVDWDDGMGTHIVAFVLHPLCFT